MNLKLPYLALALASTTPAAFAAEAPVQDLRAVFEAHEKALDNHDLKGVMRLYAPGDQTVVMGTEPAERWQGAAAIEDAYKHFFADFDAGTLHRECPWVESGTSGDLGWVAASCEYKDSLKDKPRQYALNVSVVLKKEGDGWKLLAMHYSNPTAP
jgi:ketosteroid isomerase-like protein